MREGLYVHVDEVRKVIDTFGSKSGLPQDSVTIISEEYILSEIKARAEMYITPGGRMIRRKYEQTERVE